jgi:peptide/nickel transport system substrate-binding protein
VLLEATGAGPRPGARQRACSPTQYPASLDVGDYHCDAAYANRRGGAERLRAVGIRAKLRPLERAAFAGEGEAQGLIQAQSGAFGNAATRLEAFVAAGGTYVYGSYPDIDGLFAEQATDVDPKRREATLHRIQRLVHDNAIYAPIWQLAFLNGVGPRVEHSGLGVIPGFAYSGPYEDVRLKR